MQKKMSGSSRNKDEVKSYVVSAEPYLPLFA